MGGQCIGRQQPDPSAIAKILPHIPQRAQRQSEIGMDRLAQGIVPGPPSSVRLSSRPAALSLPLHCLGKHLQIRDVLYQHILNK